MKKILIVILATIIIQTSFAQSHGFYTTRNYDKALKSGTRSINGCPGENYWQNTSSYKINAKINPTTGMLSAFQSIIYTNNSPDSIRYAVFHVFQNVYKKGAERAINVEPSEIHNGVKITKVMRGEHLFADSEIKWSGTLMYLPFKKKLAPGETTTFSMNWEFKIPEKSNVRMGKYTENSIFLGQWFPKLAVYDDIDRWDNYIHKGLAEFYSEYSDYEVAINVPENYIIQATGDLTNADKVLHPQINKRRKKAMISEDIVSIVSPRDKKVTKKGNQTWRFKATNVPDFAFGIAKDYKWEGSSVQPKGVDKKIFIDVIYNPDSKDFKDVINIAKQTITYMSEEMPGVPYPYTHMTVYNGKDGMEYPMIVNDGSTNKFGETVYVTTHEIFHSIFPIYVGISETKYGWFDEGFTVLFPEELQQRIAPEINQAVKTVNYEEIYYLNNEREPVMMTPTHYLDSNIAASINYGKSEIALRLFKEYVGDNVFRSTMKAFINEWKSKHPTPYDFFAFINDYLKTDLDWYWNKWFFEYAKTDLSIKEVTRNNDSYNIIIENIGGLPLPIELDIEYMDGSHKNISHMIDVWKDGHKSLSINHYSAKAIKQITLGNNLIPDQNKINNTKTL